MAIGRCSKQWGGVPMATTVNVPKALRVKVV